MVEVTRVHLDRIAGVDGEVAAFLHVDAAGALAAARSIDEQRNKGEPLGRLAGVPIAIKDVLWTQGMRTTCGSNMLDGWRPPPDDDRHSQEERPASSRSARRTWTSSRWARPPRTRPSAPRVTRGI